MNKNLKTTFLLFSIIFSLSCYSQKKRQNIQYCEQKYSKNKIQEYSNLVLKIKNYVENNKEKFIINKKGDIFFKSKTDSLASRIDSLKNVMYNILYTRKDTLKKNKDSILQKIHQSIIDDEITLGPAYDILRKKSPFNTEINSNNSFFFETDAYDYFPKFYNFNGKDLFSIIQKPRSSGSTGIVRIRGEFINDVPKINEIEYSNTNDFYIVAYDNGKCVKAEKYKNIPKSNKHIASYLYDENGNLKYFQDYEKDFIAIPKFIKTLPEFFEKEYLKKIYEDANINYKNMGEKEQEEIQTAVKKTVSKFSEACNSKNKDFEDFEFRKIYDEQNNPIWVIDYNRYYRIKVNGKTGKPINLKIILQSTEDYYIY